MTFLGLDIGDYFIQWDNVHECYLMYWKNSEYDARFVDKDLKVYVCNWSLIKFSSDDIVYKVIV